MESLRHVNFLADSDRLKLADKLFQIFDANRNGAIDLVELAGGISILCGGSRDDKVAAAFALYDADRDGVISRSDVVTYFVSVFKVR